MSDILVRGSASSEPASLEWTVYRLYDESETLLYAGMSKSLGKRFQAHEASKEWWIGVATIRIERFATRKEARAREHHLILWLRPAHNYIHNFFRQRDPSIKPVARKGERGV